MSKIFIGKDGQKEKDINKILDDINKKQKEIIGKLENKFNIFDSEKRKHKLKMLAILYTTYLSTLGSLEEKDFTIEDFNLIKSLEEDKDQINNFIPVVNILQNLDLEKSASIKDLYEANLLKLEKKKSDLKLERENKSKEKLEEKFKINNCIFCTEEFEENGVVNPQIMECKKYVHGKCFINYIEEELNNNRFPIRCPLCPGNEKHEINYKTILDCLLLNDKDNLAAKLENISLNHLAQNNSDEITFCPTAGCSYMCFYDNGDFHLICPLCKKEYCLQCKTEWHNNITCEEYQRGKKEEENDTKFEEYIRGSRLKQCPNCKRWVEKISGCDHIRCSCGIDFCYNCGKSYENGFHSCNQYNAGVGLFGNINIQNRNNNIFGQPFNLFGNNNNNNQQNNLFGSKNNNQNLNLFTGRNNAQQGSIFYINNRNNNNQNNFGFINNNNNQNLFGNNNRNISNYFNMGINDIQNNLGLFGTNNNNNNNNNNNQSSSNINDKMFLD